MNNAKGKLVFPELSCDVTGAAFSVYNVLGWGSSEKHCRKALAKELQGRGIRFEREVLALLECKEVETGKYFADLTVEDKILPELKMLPKSGSVHSRQALGYLHFAGSRSGALIYFGKEGVKHRRVISSRDLE